MWTQILLVLVGLITFLYFWVTRKYGYFKSRGVTEAPSYFPFGSYNNWRLFTGKLSFINLIDSIYWEYPNDKMVGTFSLSNPMLVVNDLDLAKHVLIKDFDHFVDRRTFDIDRTNKANKLFADMLTVIKGDKWKMMRNVMSPVFTSGKLKVMSGLINKVGEDFVTCLNGVAERGESFNGKEMMTSYTLDAIANCGLGVEAHGFTEPEGIFRKMVAKATGGGKANPKQMVKLLIMLAVPWVGKILKISFVDEDAMLFFSDVIEQTLKQRREDKVRRNDIVDLVLDAVKASGTDEETHEVEDDQFEKDAHVKATSVKINESEYESLLISNALLLSFAGFDTSSSIMSVCLYFLAKNPDIQEKLLEEVNEVIEANKGSQDLEYNTVMEMSYMDKVVHETLRHYPLTILERLCVKDYKVPGTDFVVPEGMLVQIPSPAIMKDEKYFPNPLEFNPENFSPENKAERTPYAFLAFGQGPRNCIGMRFALLQVKIAIFRAVANFKITTAPECPEELVVDPMSTSAQPKGGVWLKVEKRAT